MLKTLEPMLAQSRRDAFDDDRYLFEIKWDGTRAVSYIHERGHWRIRSRRGTWMESRYPELSELAALPAGTVIDGEIVVLEDGKPSFTRLQQRDNLSDPLRIEILSRRLPATYVPFDLLYLAGEDLTTQPLLERRRQLSELLQQFSSRHILHAEYVIGKGIRYFQHIEQARWEGVMAKRIDSPYSAGERSPDWLKIKVTQMDCFWVMGYVQRDQAQAVSALVVGERADGGWRYFAKVGSGFNEDQRHALYEHLSRLPEHDYGLKIDSAPVRWIAPRLRARIRYLELTQDKRLRSPVFECFVDDQSC